MKPLWWKERRKIVLACNQTRVTRVGDKILPTEALVFLKCSSIGHNTYNTSWHSFSHNPSRPWDFSGCNISRRSAASLHISWQTPAHLFLSPFTWVSKLLVLSWEAHPYHSHFWSKDEDECGALTMLITYWLRRPARLFLGFLQFPRSPAAVLCTAHYVLWEWVFLNLH